VAREGGVAADSGKTPLLELAKKEDGDGENKEDEDVGMRGDETEAGEKTEDETARRKEDEDEVVDKKEDETGVLKQLLCTSFKFGWSIDLGCRAWRSEVRRRPPFFSFAPVGSKAQFLKMLS
jgi:hypothetical protein